MIDINELRTAVEAAGLNAISMQEVLELLDRLEAAEKENSKLREALAEKVASETILRELSVGNGSINATFEGGAVQLMVDALATQFVESGAANYIEMQFHSEATGPLLFTLQRVDGKTPHQLRAEAEQERDKLRELNSALSTKSNSQVIHNARLAEENDALRAKIEEMERQEPVAHIWRCDNGHIYGSSERFLPMGTKLYPLPGAQGEEK